MDITPTRFARLSLSSPWRWRSVEFRWQDSADRSARHAWIQRPGSVRIENANGDLAYCTVRQVPVSDTVTLSTASGPRPESVRRVWAHDVSPEIDDDGLVIARPDEHSRRMEIDYDYGTYYENYFWVAMLDPREFGDVGMAQPNSPDIPPVLLTDLSAVTHHGRETWQATATSTLNYEPRCDCCSLLPGHIDYEAADQPWRPGATAVVRLDVQTGICVSVISEERTYLDMEILAVDVALPRTLFNERVRRRL